MLSARHRWTHFEQLLDRYLGALDDRAGPRVVKGLLDMNIWRQGNQDLVDLVLDHPHWPRNLKLLEEHFVNVRDRFGERRPNIRNLPRLNSLLKLTRLDLRGQGDESQWPRILRENHHGQPPPRLLVDGQLINCLSDQPCLASRCERKDEPVWRHGLDLAACSAC